MDWINVEVAYALPTKQKIARLKVKQGTTVLDAAKQSALDVEFPEINWDSVALGVFGKAVKAPAIEQVREGDRVEIYRPLLIDPKQARLNRAAKVS